jgi:hypothetical protein
MLPFSTTSSVHKIIKYVFKPFLDTSKDKNSSNYNRILFMLSINPPLNLNKHMIEGLSLPEMIPAFDLSVGNNGLSVV